MTSQPSILAIMLNWQQPKVTLECVQTLQAMAYPRLDILVIDNGSSDDSPEVLGDALLVDQLLTLPQNLGFASGCNVGLKYAIEQGFDFALLINNDAFPAPSMLEKLLNETGPDIALLSPKIYFEVEPERIWFGNGRQHPITLDLRDTGRGQIDGPEWGNSRDVDYLLGTCLLVNLAAVEKVGFFDERYFMYFEDLDWSLRFRQAGYRLRLIADAHLYHRVAVSSGGLESPMRRYHLARSSVIFWQLHAHLGRPWIIFLFRMASAIRAVGRLLLWGEAAVALAYCRGLRDGWCTVKYGNSSLGMTSFRP